MPTFNIELAETGELYRTFTIEAATEEEAVEKVWEEEPNPTYQRFKQRDLLSKEVRQIEGK